MGTLLVTALPLACVCHNPLTNTLTYLERLQSSRLEVRTSPSSLDGPPLGSRVRRRRRRRCDARPSSSHHSGPRTRSRRSSLRSVNNISLCHLSVHVVDPGPGGWLHLRPPDGSTLRYHYMCCPLWDTMHSSNTHSHQAARILICKSLMDL